jgi:DNA-binding LacI/PurR family transcriptional regulator
VAGVRPNRVTSADVARAAGYSRQLVGFVLNNTPGQSIPETTRTKVLLAAEQLGYVPHGPAQALRRGQGRTVLFVLPDLRQGPTMGDLIVNLADELAAHGLTLVTYLLGAEHRSPRAVAAALAPIAVLGLNAFTVAEVATFRASGAAVVFPRPDSRESGRFEESGRLLGAMQVDYLADLGHRQIAFAVPDDERAAFQAAGRYEGACQAAAARGLPPVPRGIVDEAGAETAVREWRSGPDPVTAVACFDDDIAFAVLAAARHLGLRVPADLAVIGAEDIPAARYAEPPLTTISVDATSAGTALARAVIGMLGEQAAAPMPDIDEAIRITVRSSA